jgi:hypothetical protein
MSGEKITAALCTLTAIAILGAGVVAQPARKPVPVPAPAPASDRTASLQSDLSYQLELAYRHNRAAFRERTAELEQTLAAWRAAPQSPADQQLFEQWLRESIRRSLPNRLEPLPPTPAFGAVEQAAEEVQAVVVAKQVAMPSNQTRPRETPSELAPPAPPQVEHQPLEAAPTTEPVASLSVQPTPTAAKTRPVAAESETVAAPPKEPTTKPSTSAPQIAAAAPPEPVSINLAELNARIAGYHDALKEIDAAIVAAGDGPTLALATRLVGQIERLAEHRRFAMLYFDSLTKRERLHVIEPRPLTETVELVQKLVKSVEPPAADDFLAAAEAADPRSELLERLQAASN